MFINSVIIKTAKNKNDNIKIRRNLYGKKNTERH